ncbi:putative OVARIAN TUMOR DOMAIN-containing deubiquitinating enzyme 11 [Nannochloris sp. 'desiccata']|nr:putative OVARIAN TUMOR DOMAIN-containing deubiquitinating enzyme 11 [Chlorella desiccata (nom. nud.)]
MKPPLPRKVTPGAQKLHDEVSRPPRDSALRRRAKKQRINYSTISHSHHSMGKQPAVLGAEVPSASMIRMLSSDSTTAEEDQVDRILDAGAERLFKSEDGRQRIRNGSFNIDETAKTMLEAATEALEEGEGAECSDDSGKAKDACEEIKRGGMDVGKVAQRVKEKVTGFGSSNGNRSEVDDEFVATNPVLLESESGRRESLSMYRQLSAIQAPLIVGREEATVNLSSLNLTVRDHSEASATSNSFNHRQFARVKSMSLARPSPNVSAPPPTTHSQSAPAGGFSGLQWTESRKLLEAAIMFEQVDPSIDPHNYYRQDLATQETLLVSRLSSLGLHMEVQKGDGNCQFRSLSYGLFGTPDYHRTVRKTTVDYIFRNRHYFELFLGGDFKAWAQQMVRDRTWGDELTLRAACEAYGVVVNVVTSDSENWFLRYCPEHTVVQREVFLTYISPVHYNGIRKMSRGPTILRSMSSLGRRNSRVVAALDEYERTMAVPKQPTDVLA